MSSPTPSPPPDSPSGGPPDEVYEAAESAMFPSRFVPSAPDDDTPRDPGSTRFRTVVDRVWSAGVAEGRRQAAADILATGLPDDQLMDGNQILLGRDHAARIARGKAT